MTTNTAERHEPDLYDRSFYADLWGNTSRAAQARDSWRSRRMKSGVLALIALGVLLSYLTVGAILRPADDAPGVSITGPTIASVTEDTKTGD